MLAQIIYLKEEAYRRGWDKSIPREGGWGASEQESKQNPKVAHPKPDGGKYFSTQALVELLNCLIVKFKTKKWMRSKEMMTVRGITRTSTTI